MYHVPQGGFTPLHFASRAGHLEVVCLLVESGASPAQETKDGKVALNFAAANNHADVLSYLLKKEHDTHRLMDDKKVENPPMLKTIHQFKQHNYCSFRRLRMKLRFFFSLFLI